MGLHKDLSLRNGGMEELVTLLGTFTHAMSFLSQGSLFILENTAE